MLTIATLLAFGICISCKRAGPPPVVDAGMASCIASDTVALAAVDLDRLRASPFLNGMGGSARDLFERYGTSSKLLIAWNGNDFTIVERGLFKTPPADASMVEPGLAVAGSPNRIAAAVAQHNAGPTGAASLIDYGSAIGARSAVWLAARGGTALPLSGNLANLNMLFEDADNASAALDLGEQTTLRFAARGRTTASAARLEERLRGFLSLATAAETRRPEVARLIGATQIARNGRDVTATLTAPPDMVAKLLAGFAR
jgi:hypothetical protein